MTRTKNVSPELSLPGRTWGNILFLNNLRLLAEEKRRKPMIGIARKFA